ncbi:hypothetical protein BaRGS_00034848 [Batillaria attramentaria]|uniref:Uncharacterized protein n=1 Tax=Batillaria attramentaria TaxID=370345 RepID=A0ABD0JGK8_9CAEN
MFIHRDQLGFKDYDVSDRPLSPGLCVYQSEACWGMFTRNINHNKCIIYSTPSDLQGAPLPSGNYLFLGIKGKVTISAGTPPATGPRAGAHHVQSVRNMRVRCR